MAAQIPTREDLPNVRYDSGRISAPGPQDYVGPAVSGLGRAIGGLAQDVAVVSNRNTALDEQRKNYDALAEVSDLVARHQNQADEAIRTMQPGAAGLYDERKKAYQTDATAFLNSPAVSPEKRGYYEKYLTDQGEIIANHVRDAAGKEISRFAGETQNTLDEQQLDAIFNAKDDPKATTQAETLLYQTTKNNPNLTPIEKAARLKILPDRIMAAKTSVTIADRNKLDAVLMGEQAASAPIEIPPQYPLFSKTQATKDVPGMFAPGNIDLTKRPTVHNADGSISTVYTTSYSPETGPLKGKEVLIPRVSNEGTVMSEHDAIRYWGEKKQNLGAFNSVAEADAYAKILHEQLYDTAHKPVGGDLTKSYTLTPEQAGFRPAGADKGGLQSPKVGVPTGTSTVMPRQPMVSGSREQHSMQVLQSEGMSNVGAAGLLGNFIAESGDKLNPNAVNPHDGADGSDSIGIGQWNSNRAIALKAFAASRGKPWNDLDTQLAFAAHEMKTSYPGAWARLQAARTGDEAAGVVVTQYTKPAGSQSGAVASHQWARRRDNAIRLAGGQYTPGDNSLGRTSPADLPDGGFGRARDWIRAQNPNASPGAVDRLAAEMLKQYNSNQHIDRQEVNNVNDLIKADNASIMATGQEVPSLSSERVSSAIGQEAADQWAASRADAHKYYAMTNDFDRLPANEIGKRLQQIEPTPGSETFLKEQAYYKAANDAATHVLAQRVTDPASAVSSLPDVQAAAQAVDIQNPATLQALGNARMAAQAAVGIPPSRRSPVTAAEAKLFVDDMTNIVPGQEATRIREIFDQLRTIYGDNADEALQFMLRQHKQDEDVARAATALMKTLSLGQLPPKQQGEAFQDAVHNQAVTDAGAGLAEPPAPTGEPSTRAAPAAAPAGATPAPAGFSGGFPRAPSGAARARQSAADKAAGGAEYWPAATVADINDVRRNPALGAQFRKVFGDAAYNAAVAQGPMLAQPRAGPQEVGAAALATPKQVNKSVPPIVDPSIVARQGPQGPEAGTRRMDIGGKGAGSGVPLIERLGALIPTIASPKSVPNTAAISPQYQPPAGGPRGGPGRAPSGPAPAPPASTPRPIRRRARNTSGFVPQPDIPGKK